MPPLRIVAIAAECEPWAKTGGLGDVVDALGRATGAIGELERAVDVFLPRYASVPVPAGAAPSRVVHVPDPTAAGGTSEVSIVDIDGHGYRLRLIDHPAAFLRSELYGYPDDAWRFGLLCAAALETMAIEQERIDVIHLHDWHAGPAAIFRDVRFADDPTVSPAAMVLTIHNLAYQGWVARDRLSQLGLTPGDGFVVRDAAGIGLLRSAIDLAERVNTVSPTFARESLTAAIGFGLEGVLRARGDRYSGILNGLDTALWDPATDVALAAPYDVADLGGKAACRNDLASRLGLDVDDETPILGAIGRLDPQKGFDLIAEAAPAILSMGGRLVVQGAGAGDIAAPLRRLAASAPRRFALVERFDRAMARRIYAGADLFLMPSRFEPCGQGQMIAMRYGTVPVVHRTGGLADTVVDEATRPGQGTGFVFGHATVEELLWAIGEAFAVRGDGTTDRWLALLRRAMTVDHDWRTGSAPAYLGLYEQAMADRQAAMAGPTAAREVAGKVRSGRAAPRPGTPRGGSSGGSADRRRS